MASPRDPNDHLRVDHLEADLTGMAGAAALTATLTLVCFLGVPASRRAPRDFRRLPNLMLGNGARA